jgi:DNA uptake protein ComE-like DNA-binding protein
MTARPNLQTRRRRRGFILIAVMIVLACAILIATSLLYFVQSDVAAAEVSLEAAQARALAWSGVQAIASELDRGRRTILEGAVPDLPSQFVIFEAGDQAGVVRLLPLGPGGERLIPEAGRIDLNAADAGMLAATGLVDLALAESIVAHRESTLARPFQSEIELLQAPGMTAETLFGPPEAMTPPSAAAFEDMAGDVAAPFPAGPRGLADVVTVYGFEPALQRNGNLRLNLNVEWSSELADRVADRFSRDIANTLEQICQSGTKFDSEKKIYQVLRFFQVDPADWPDVVDTFTTESGDYHHGRLDINTASYEALLALPGMTAEQAEQIVRLRDGLPREELATVAWPAIEGVLSPEAYDELAGRITTRSWTYRVRVAAGLTAVDAPEGPLDKPVIWEAVIDLSAPRARIAYLRDATLLDPVTMIAVNAESFLEADGDLAAASDDGDTTALGSPEDSRDGGAAAPSDDPEGGDEGRPDGGLDMDTSLDLDGDAETPDPDQASPPAAEQPAGLSRIGRWRRGD